MEKVINKLSQWLHEEMEISNELAHDVATAETVEEMVKVKNVYEIQNAKTDAIREAIRLVEETENAEGE